MNPLFYITHLYPDELNIYGDMGNIITLNKRLTGLGFQPVYQTVGLGQKLPMQTDIYFIGGGQDKEQLIVCKDLLEKKDRLEKDVENGVVVLAICGGYQLLGKEFITGDNEVVQGLGILDIQTTAPNSDVKSRCVGNLFVQSSIPEINNYLLIGFENHSGQTKLLSEKVIPLGKVISGFGNDSSSGFEGAKYKNVFGTYLHGSVLPKNPQFCDYLIMQAVRNKTEKGQINPQIYLKTLKKKLSDGVALETRKKIVQLNNLEAKAKHCIV